MIASDDQTDEIIPFHPRTLGWVKTAFISCYKRLSGYDERSKDQSSSPTLNLCFSLNHHVDHFVSKRILGSLKQLNLVNCYCLVDTLVRRKSLKSFLKSFVVNLYYEI